MSEDDKLTITVPKDIRLDQLARWIRKRIPREFPLPSEIKTIVSITVVRTHATKPFLATYEKQNNKARTAK